MDLGKSLSLGSAFVSALVTGAVLSYFSISHPGVVPIIVASLAIGLFIFAIHQVFLGRFSAEIHRIVDHTESLANVELQPRPRQKRSAALGLTAVMEAVERTVGALRARVDKLVTQRRELEVQVRIAEAERRHAEAILSSISDAVIVTDAFDEVVLANESAARMFGFEPTAIARSPVDQLLGDQTLVKLIKDTREGGPDGPELRRQVEHQIDHRGQQHICDVTLASLTKRTRDKAETMGVVTVLHDITKEKAISEMKSDFVSNVSHELRTPLSSIKAYMEMLIDGEANDDHTRAEFYNIIQSETNRLCRLIDNILNINRIESGIVKVQREHISLYGLIKEAVDVMKPQARAKNIDLTFTSQVLVIQVIADKDMIYQAALNLMSNAIKYTPANGKVNVSIEVNQPRKMARVSVADTGVGIGAEDLTHLFEKFYRVKDHRNLAKGTGLGLTLVKHIIETVHGGEVEVTSRENVGSTFTFTLPLADHGY